MTDVRLEHLQRVFYEGFTAIDLAEPLLSHDASTDLQEVAKTFEAESCPIIGIRQQGKIVGYVHRDSLDATTVSTPIHFESDRVVPHDGSFTDVVKGLSRHPFLYVSVLGSIYGLVTRDDIQKAPMRMWLFGMITLIEERLTQLIKRHGLAGDWQSKVSEGRLEKARTLQQERNRRGQSVELLDCLQFSDKGQIISRSESLRSHTRMASRRQFESLLKQVERLRNGVAHSQDVTDDWDTIVLLAENLDDILAGPQTAAVMHP